MKEPCEGAPAANDTGGAYIYIYIWEGSNEKGVKIRRVRRTLHL